jgi:photosystem II cytochrome c550
MLKRILIMLLVTVMFVWQSFASTANALNLTEENRTVPLNDQGDKITLSNQEAQLGSQLFVANCAQCHIQGKTKTNPDVSLSDVSLSGAVPDRYNLLGLADYIKYPTSYDGEEDYSLLHINTENPDLWPEIRNYTEQDIKALAGYILIQINSDARWGKRSLIDGN